MLFLTAAMLFAGAAAPLSASAEDSGRRLLRIGYIEASFSPSERQGFEETFRYLQRKLPQYRLEVRNYLVRDLERGVQNNEFEFFIAASGFYRRVFHRGLKDLATMTTAAAPDPNNAVGTVFMVPRDSRYQTVRDLKGLRAAANFERGFTGVYIPLGEIAAQGFNPDSFFKEIVPAGSPMKKLLLAVQRGEADVALARACTVEELQQTEPEFVAQFRPVGLKPGMENFACMRSTDLYPNWTFVATTMAPWQASRDITAALLSMPPTAGGVGWGVASDFLKVDDLYKTLKRGPYSYLRIQSVGDFVERFWPFILLALMAVLGMFWHERRVTHLVDVRTRELKIAMQRQKDAMEEAQGAKERLARFERISVIGAMSSLIAHEINGPVSAIANSCTALEQALENDPQPGSPLINKTMSLIQRQCSRITAIVSHVRNYARHKEMAAEPIQAVAGLQKMIAGLQLRLPGIRFLLKAPGEDVLILWNPLEFELSLTNLMKNAAEACVAVQSPQVTVSVTPYEHTVEFTVADNGPDDRQAMKNAAGALQSGKENGLGLGLLIVRTLVEKASGSFSIVREADQTVARIRLPLLEKEK